MSKVWIDANAYRELEAEADAKFPLETGGVLVGYRGSDGPVVMCVVGPGPHARHERTRFDPDHNWQCTQLDLQFEKNPSERVYLGDWHTHPNGRAELSNLDKRTLREISEHAGAAAPQPLMVIGAGQPGNWTWKCHQRLGTGACLFRRRLLELEIVLF